MSSTPFLYADSNFSVFHLDVVGPQLDRKVELVLSRPHVVLPAVPGAGEDATFEPALAEGSLEMQAVRLHCVEAAVAVGERYLLVARTDGSDGSGWDLFHPGDWYERALHGGDPTDT
jgi:hypothetical protein